MILNLIYDGSVGSAPVGFTAALNRVVSFFQSNFLDPVTVNIAVGYGEIRGQAMDPTGLGSSISYFNSYSYSQIRSALAADSSSADDASSIASLPLNNPNGGNYWMTTAQAKAAGLQGASSQLDGYVGFSANPLFDYDNTNGVPNGQYDFFGTVAHEISEVMGRQLLVGSSLGGGPAYGVMDLFHFSAPGVHSFVGSQAGYFSVDNGVTNLNNFNTMSRGDYGDWSGSAGQDAFLAFTGSGVHGVSAPDLTLMDVLGWGRFALGPPTLIETAGATTLAGVGGHFSLLDNNGAGPSLNYSGGNVVVGQFGAWAPIGAEKIGSGYEVAWKDSGANQYTLWSADANGNYVANIVGKVSGSDLMLMSSENLFQQDLNGDGKIGLGATTPIETHGATTLAGVGNHFGLLDNNGVGPSLKYAGSDVTTGQFGAWAPIGAEQTASGYEIAWKATGADRYTLWSTDANGNYIANLIGAVPGADSALVSAETLFQQDLNGDGQIGLPTTPIETRGATTLAGVGNHFGLLDNHGVGPSLKYSGGDVLAGQFGAWAPIGAEKIGSGYEIAWKATGANQYTLWSADANGNYVANIVGAVSGSDSMLASSESLFQQDLNGDGHIGLGATTPIEANGATTLAGVGSHFSLLDSNGVGPSLKNSGSDVTSGQFGAWAPIGAEKTASGYEIAWKATGADHYTLWSTDANGNYIANLIGSVPGTNSVLVSSEGLFQQDLNGDGHIGAAGMLAGMSSIEFADQATMTAAELSMQHYVHFHLFL